MTNKTRDITAKVLATPNDVTGVYDLVVDGNYIGTTREPFRCASDIPTGPVGDDKKPLTTKQVETRIKSVFPGAKVTVEGYI